MRARSSEFKEIQIVHIKITRKQAPSWIVNKREFKAIAQLGSSILSQVKLGLKGVSWTWVGVVAWVVIWVVEVVRSRRG